MTTPSDPLGQSAGGGYGFPPPAAGPGTSAPRDSAPSAGLTIARPPSAFIAAAGGLALIGVVLGAVFGGSGPLAVVGWLAAGPLAIGTLSAFTLVDTSRRATSVYTEPSWVKPAYWTVLAVAAVGIILCALRIADWIGRL